MLYGILHLCAVLAAYLAVLVYILFRIRQVFTPKSRWYRASVGLSIGMSLLFIPVLFLRIFNMGSWILPFQTVAFLWLTFVIYFSLSLFGLDVFRASVYLVRPWRKKSECWMLQLRKFFLPFAFVLSISLLGYGLYHFTKPKIVNLAIETDKDVPNWTIVAVSDLHLGTMTPQLLQENVKTINALNPDVVLLLGDQFVINWRDVVPLGYASVLRQLRAAQGVYAIQGNHESFHEFSHNEDPRVQYLYDYLKINMLEDTVVLLNDKVALIGRSDSSRLYSRKSLPELMSSVDESQFSILLDHRPIDLKPAEECGVDLQLSGHTHNGQLFPMNIFQWAKSLFNNKLYYGYRKVGGTQYYVTSGLGGSGAPVRVGTTGEIVVIRFVGFGECQRPNK